MPGQHALLSPSAAHRWINCTAAPRLEQHAPDNSSSYAQEGTLAHAICARKLKEFLGQNTKGEQAEIDQLKEAYYCGEMEEYTDTYTAIVLEKYNAAKLKTKDAQLLVETRLQFDDYVPQSFGTADALIIADGCMDVIDFKYGKGVRVDATDNSQMKIYALGAYLANCFEYRIERICMTIVQPRIDNICEFEINVSDLMDWAENELKPKAKQAYDGTGEQNPGTWCQFCKVKSSCKALAARCIETAEEFSDPKLVSKADMESRVLPMLDTIKTWLTGMEEYALQQALAGTSYNGYKVVEGRSNRKITDEAKAREILAKEGYAETEYMKPATLCGITDLEKLVGKKRFAALMAAYIVKPQGKPTLVPATDKRPVYSTAASDFDGIEVNENINPKKQTK